MQASFVEYHFCETATAGNWYFDYRLKAGPLTTRNALRLLARLHYPAQVVAAAQALSATLATRAQSGSTQPIAQEELSSVTNATT